MKPLDLLRPEGCSADLPTHLLVPSAVAIHDGKMIIGEGAKRLLARAAELGLERDKTLFLECKSDMCGTPKPVPATVQPAPDNKLDFL